MQQIENQGGKSERTPSFGMNTRNLRLCRIGEADTLPCAKFSDADSPSSNVLHYGCDASVANLGKGILSMV